MYKCYLLNYWDSGIFYKYYLSYILVKVCISLLLMMLISHQFSCLTTGIWFLLCHIFRQIRYLFFIAKWHGIFYVAHYRLTETGTKESDTAIETYGRLLMEYFSWCCRMYFPRIPLTNLLLLRFNSCDVHVW